jgi:RNA polymerase sigma-54 factor
LGQPSFDLRAAQHLTLTPRLQQSVKLLQLSALELAQELQHALANNPFLEEDEAGTAAEDSADPNASTDASTELGSERTGEPEATFSDLDAASQTEPSLVSSIEIESADGEAYSESSQGDESDLYGDSGTDSDYLSEYPKHERRKNGDSSDDDYVDAGEWRAAQLSLREHLHRALTHYRLSERDRMLAELVIEALEDDGYLRQDLAELTGAFPIDPPPDDCELSMAVKLVQQLDVPGIAARDLAECLHLQLQALGLGADTGHGVAQHTVKLAGQLIDRYLNQLARREYTEVGRVLGCCEDEIRGAFQLIRSLDPKPGLRYGHSGVTYVVPDVIVRKIKGVWRVATNTAVLPRARLNKVYADLFKQAHCKDRAPLAQELQEARWLMRNVEQRFSTIQRVAETIVAHQRNFFEYGDAALKPFGLRECAELLDLHESTISRATGNKYMATPRGIFEFKHFFSRELATESGGTCSAAAVRALLKGMVEAEDAGTPLSDVELTRMLASRGVVVARRTVTKYRGQLKLPSADLRRQI